MSSKEIENSEAKAAAEPEMHKPPSVLWFVIPLVGIVLYALFTR